MIMFESLKEKCCGKESCWKGCANFFYNLFYEEVEGYGEIGEPTNFTHEGGSEKKRFENHMTKE